MKKISIIMTVKNETKFLLNVLKQLCPQNPDELIIVDGNSTDDHIGLFKTLQKKYKFKLVKNKLSGKYDSPFGAFVKGLKVASHEFVSLWSVDDDPYPDYLKTMKEAVNTYDADLFICSADVSRENRKYQKILYPFDCYVSPECFIKNFKTFGRRMNYVGCVIKKSKIEECVPYLTKVNFDNTYIFRIALGTGFFNIGKPLLLYRSYLNSHGQLGKWKDIKEWIRVTKKMFEPEIYKKAEQIGLWSREKKCLPLLRLFPKLPLFLRRRVYDKIYSYDSREEK